MLIPQKGLLNTGTQIVKQIPGSQTFLNPQLSSAGHPGSYRIKVDW